MVLVVKGRRSSKKVEYVLYNCQLAVTELAIKTVGDCRATLGEIRRVVSDTQGVTGRDWTGVGRW